MGLKRRNTIPVIIFFLFLSIGLYAFFHNLHSDNNNRFKQLTTPSGIWHAIHVHMASLHKSIIQNKLRNVPTYTHAIVQLLTALPHHSGYIQAEQLAQIKSLYKHIDMLAKNLNAISRANDAAGSLEKYRIFKKAIDDYRNYYQAITKQPN